MEKQYKPVPDCEALRYKGTPEKPDIKIFVSHRTDLDSETINNPLYIPVRCGAANDVREGVEMLGDDTGDNISDKKANYSELTAQYWAWKNIDADYYGLCHYRRYLSFSGPHKGICHEAAFVDSFTDITLEKFGLLDEDSMRNTIRQYDMVLNKEFDVKNAPTVRGGRYNTVYDHWVKGSKDVYLKDGVVDCLIDTIINRHPEYADITKRYFSGDKFRGFNCFILKKELFDDLCAFEFDVLFKMEQICSDRYASEQRKRFLAYCAEMLYSIWTAKKISEGKYRIKETQIVFFFNSEQQKSFAAHSDNAATVVFTATEDSLPLLATSIRSILSNISSDKWYDIIVLMQDIRGKTLAQYEIALSKNHQNAIKDMCTGYPNVQLSFYDPRKELGKLHVTDTQIRSQEQEFYLLMAPWIFPNQNKLLMLKPGLIVECDIAEICECELKDLCAGAVKSIMAQSFLCGSDDQRKEKIMALGLQDPFNVFDTSVVLLNLEQIRSRFSKTEMIDFCFDHNWEEYELFSVKFENNILALSPEINYMVINPVNEFCFCYAPNEIQSMYRSVKRPKVLNFNTTGSFLPWIMPNVISGYSFWKYARQTPFYEMILSNCTAASSSLPHYSKVRQLADIVMPKGTRRREFAKRILPKGTRRWNFLKKIYYSLGGK